MIKQCVYFSSYLITTTLCNILEVGGTVEGGQSIYLGVFGIESADGNILKYITNSLRI